MAWTDDVFSSGGDVQTQMQSIENNFQEIIKNYASATEPVSPKALQFWADTTNNILKLRNEANNGWQFIWDFGNNQPMGSVTTRGTVAYAGTQLLDNVTISRGTTVTRIATGDFNFCIAGGAPVNKAAVPAGTAWSTTFTIQQNTWGIYVVAVNGSGTITFTAGAGNFNASYASEAAAISAMPATPGGTCRLGYVTIHAAVSAGWTEGTNALEGGGGSNPAQKTNYYVDTPENTYTGTVTPTPSEYSVSVYYVLATNRNYIATPTINLNSLGTKAIKSIDGDTLGNVWGTIVDSHYMILYYNGTNFVLLNPAQPPHGMSAYTTAGSFTWVRPKGVTQVFVRVWGGGGGGSGNNGDAWDCIGGRGGFGGYSEGWITVSGDCPVVVGIAGTAGAYAGTGGNGGASSFTGNTTIQANGGTGGTHPYWSGGGRYYGTNGTDGTASGGSINTPLIYIINNFSIEYTYGSPGTAAAAYEALGNQASGGVAGIQGLVLVYW